MALIGSPGDSSQGEMVVTSDSKRGCRGRPETVGGDSTGRRFHYDAAIKSPPRRYADREEHVDAPELDQLLQRARRHDPQALGALAEAYGPRVYGLLYRLTGSREMAEDFAQETFLRVVRTIGTYEHRGRFESWLFRIAANLARDHARKNKRQGPVHSLDAPAGEDDSIVPDVPDPEEPRPMERLVEREDGARLEACLAELPEIDRQIILLRHFSELSFREIAEMLGIPLGTALARAHRAMRRLRARLSDGNES